jgi:hypothetical protein
MAGEFLCPVCKSDLRETMTEDEVIPNSVSINEDGETLDYDYDSGDSEYTGEYKCCWCSTILTKDSVVW